MTFRSCCSMRRSRWRSIPDRVKGALPGFGPRRAASRLLCRFPLWLPVLLASAVPVAAQELQRDCCLLLLVPVGAGSSAMGGAITAAAGPEAVFRNPAGLVGSTGTSFVLHHSDRSMVDINAFSLVFSPSIGGAGLSYQLFDKGTIGTTDPTGQPTGELSYRDHLVVGSLGVAVGRSMAVGASYKFFQERIDCRGACSGAERVTTFHAFDLGYRFAPQAYPALQLGIAAVNVALGATPEHAPGAFPSRLHVGASYELLQLFWTEELAALRLGLDFQDNLRDLGSIVPSAGLELDVQQMLFLRAGYTLGDGLASGAAIGVGLRYDRFDIGVSRSFVNTGFEEGEPFQITFGVHF
jgi:hypothetical protein